MAQITGYTAERMKAIEDGTVVQGTVDVNGNLILTRKDGTTFNAGPVIGPKGDVGATGPGVPTGGTVGQFLKKNSGANYDTVWGNLPADPTYNRQVFTASGTWTKPAGATRVVVELWGGGGGGSTRTDTYNGGGGGGGYFKHEFLASELTATESVTIGAGGVSHASAAGNGGDTVFDKIRAYGGKGGTTASGDGGGPHGGINKSAPVTLPGLWGGGAGGQQDGGVGQNGWFGAGGGGGGAAAGGTSVLGGNGGFGNGTNGVAPGGGGGAEGVAGSTGFGARGEAVITTHFD